MRIQLTHKYVLTSNEYNLIVERVMICEKGDNIGKVYLKPLAYFGTLQQLVNWLAEHEIKSSTVQSIVELRSEIKLFCESIRGLSDIIEKKWTEKKPY